MPTTTHKLASVPEQRRLSRQAARARDTRGHRVLWALVALTILGVLALSYTVWSVTGHSSAQDGAITQLGDQVRSLGAVPVVTPETVPGAAGLPGAAGVDGAPGAQGVPGVSGTPGAPGVNGQSPACLSTPPQCQGADGAPGAAGAAGVGVPGADGTPGKDGQDGAPGKDGADGAPGADGKPPAGFSFTDPLGRTQNCTRDTGSPDDAATYTCTTSGGALGMGAPISLRLTGGSV